ncbi:MAG: energy-coupled thiamine transporter ThiT [Oscillospiraceae bacterium]|nr:energy-coupled thiamine transporter ThiT [Oscillospiraceae bacterium]
MQTTTRSRELRALVESALLVGIGFALSYIRFTIMPQGGSVTAVSMLPLLMIGLRHGLKWGLMGAIVYAGLQMLQQIWAPPSGTAPAWTAMIMLDYIVAFGVLGLSGIFKNRRGGIIIAAPLCLLLRYLSHFISGVIIWGYFITESHSLIDNLSAPAAWIFSLTYNGTYMIPEIIFTTVAGVVLWKTAPMLFSVENRQPQSEAVS